MSDQNQAYFDEGKQVWRWKSNNRIPFEDMLQSWDVSNLAHHAVVRADELHSFLQEYRANQGEPSQEERYEMRAAFGEGVEVIDVFSGRRTRT